MVVGTAFALSARTNSRWCQFRQGTNALMKPGRAGYELKPIYDCLQLVVLSVIPSAEHKCYPHENCRLIPQNCDRKGNNLSCQWHSSQFRSSPSRPTRYTHKKTCYSFLIQGNTYKPRVEWPAICSKVVLSSLHWGFHQPEQWPRRERNECPTNSNQQMSSNQEENSKLRHIFINSTYIALKTSRLSLARDCISGKKGSEEKGTPRAPGTQWLIGSTYGGLSKSTSWHSKSRKSK